ncbi:MAG: hypothetical protein WCI53_11670 [Bacteroidota bacterium]|jgi:hypothetical protein
MRDAGVYTQLWKKYLPVIRLLLKKTADGDQKLQIYKHEFVSTGAKNKLGYIFNLEIVNGKAVNKSNTLASSFDMLNVLNDNDITSEWLKGKTVRISVNKACELTLHQDIIIVEEPTVAPEIENTLEAATA